ncbi:hypothetical protein [Microbacterium sp. No. 7]|uniref:hypothetical protein n=1 Tax=Microbacterium sp. No. 7 TaxID=1714373 RepID=UPI0006CFE420|nr:hypothetical protein [Microbacterium sp. No. 7]ALJ22061.1 hypothetical protein AOA12_20065 [Microbacterium sp. No. 7]
MTTEIVQIGTVHVQCPACDTVVPVNVTGRLLPESHTKSGRCELACDPDMTDLYAHVWTHQDA